MKMTLTILLAVALCHIPLQGKNLTDNSGAYPIHAAGTESPVTVLSSFPTELTVDGLASLARGNFVIQMGAFSRRANAESLKNKLEQMLGLAVDVIEEGNMFKVFINNSLRGNAPCLYIPVSFPAPARHEESSAGAEENREAQVSEEPIEAAQDTIPETTVAGPAPPESEAAEEIEPVTASDEVKPVKRNIRNMFFLKGDSPWLNRYNYFGKSVALVNALIFTIIGSFVSMIVLLVVILLNRNRMEKEARLRQYLLEQYQSLIIDYLFGNSGSDAFRKIASDDYRRQVLIDQMIDVSANLKGDSEEKLMKLYKELNLDEDSLARVRSRKWHKKIKGFRELAFMGIRDGNDEMYKALNSRNEILRMEAQIALVRLSDENHFDFLSQLKRPFSLWEQITLHDLIIQHEIPVPDFQKWLTSPNPTVVMFALRMIREFRQKEAEQEIRKILLHRDQRVSQLAVEVAGDLDLRSTLDTMKRMYKFQEYNNCLEIVKSMGKMPEQSMLGFLKLVLDKEDDVQLQIEAVKAIENMGEIGVQALVKVMKSEYKNYNIIVRHVLDRRIY
ncbi:MAG: SPOR domain-containing protein [Bacteroidales bacterium]|nr:SPOR domain-containing protein [Bacteroidales bacterium]